MTEGLYEKTFNELLKYARGMRNSKSWKEDDWVLACSDIDDLEKHIKNTLDRCPAKTLLAKLAEIKEAQHSVACCYPTTLVLVTHVIMFLLDPSISLQAIENLPKYYAELGIPVDKINFQNTTLINRMQEAVSWARATIFESLLAKARKTHFNDKEAHKTTCQQHFINFIDVDPNLVHPFCTCQTT